MREILFRGKRLDNGEWVEGDLYHRNDEVLVENYQHGFSFGVDPATVGQYTGFADKNGERIFEGDILERGSRYRWLVSFKRCSFIANNAKDGRNRLSTRYWGSSQIIGNIHNNPELLERGVENAPAVR